MSESPSPERGELSAGHSPKRDTWLICPPKKSRHRQFDIRLGNIMGNSSFGRAEVLFSSENGILSAIRRSKRNTVGRSSSEKEGGAWQFAGRRGDISNCSA